MFNKVVLYLENISGGLVGQLWPAMGFKTYLGINYTNLTGKIIVICKDFLSPTCSFGIENHHLGRMGHGNKMAREQGKLFKY